MIKPIITVGLISFTGAWAFAQAPVVDLNDPKQANQTQQLARKRLQLKIQRHRLLQRHRMSSHACLF
jgi:hypothetical protein